MNDHKDESAIHKAWVALNGNLNNVIDDITGSRDSLLKCISVIGSFSIGDYAFCVENYYNKSIWEHVCTTQEFTDFCEKMAAEELRMKAIMQNGNEGLHYDNTAQQVESLAVNDKPIFTQAMLSNSEKLKFSEIDLLGKISLCKHKIKGGLIQFYHNGQWTDQNADITVRFNENDIYRAKPIDTRTDREKAIDLALSLDEYRDGLGMMSRKDFIGKLYDVGMLKC